MGKQKNLHDMFPRIRLLIAGLALPATLSGCATHPEQSVLPVSALPGHASEVSVEQGWHSVTISVLTYNVAGLPWPIKNGTGKAMGRIRGAFEQEFLLARPDVLLLQEAFVPSATRLVFAAGYRNFLQGPTASARPNPDSPPADREFVSGRKRSKGERSARLTNAGLTLATNHAISKVEREPFGKHSCAGFDCLSNKGMMLVRIELPNIPEPLYVLNTHMNSRGSSGVPPERSLLAHNRQVRELSAFIQSHWPGDGPLIYGGDFNTRNAPDRFEYKDERLPGEWAHRYCHSMPSKCDVQMSWDSDAPWMDTQDLQGYINGANVSIVPVAMKALFDAPVDGQMLSDHDALLVTYKLSWKR